MKRVNWHIPEAAGINVWPNVSSTRDELRSQVMQHLTCCVSVIRMTNHRHDGLDNIPSPVYVNSCNICIIRCMKDRPCELHRDVEPICA